MDSQSRLNQVQEYQAQCLGEMVFPPVDGNEPKLLNTITLSQLLKVPRVFNQFRKLLLLFYCYHILILLNCYQLK